MHILFNRNNLEVIATIGADKDIVKEPYELIDLGNKEPTFEHKDGKIIFNGLLTRESERKTNMKSIKVGDKVLVELKDGEQVEIVAIDRCKDGTVCTFRDCIEGYRSMNDTHTTEGGYLGSEMRKFLNGELLERFPDEIKERLQQDENGDYLRLFTEKEVFGENRWAKEKESDDVQQLEYFKDRHNRIAFDGINGTPDWWWLANPASATDFCLCNCYGYADYLSAGYAHDYVRPRFVIKA